MTGQTIATKADIIIGTAAATSSMWIPSGIEDVYMGYMMFGGAFLVTIRAALSIREWLRGRNGPPPSQ